MIPSQHHRAQDSPPSQAHRPSELNHHDKAHISAPGRGGHSDVPAAATESESGPAVGGPAGTWAAATSTKLIRVPRFSTLHLNIIRVTPMICVTVTPASADSGVTSSAWRRASRRASVPGHGRRRGQWPTCPCHGVSDSRLRARSRTVTAGWCPPRLCAPGPGGARRRAWSGAGGGSD